MSVTPLREDAPVLFSIEAEQQVLGTLLLSNGRLAGKVEQAGGAGLFHDPVHGRIFDVIAEKARAGELVSPITLKLAMATDDGLADLGGPPYLARLAGAAMGESSLDGYVRALGDLRHRRQIATAVNEAQSALSRGVAADSIAMQLEGALIACERSDGATKPVSMLAAVSAAIDSASAAYHGDPQPGVVTTGLARLDAILPGMYPGELILIGGRPSMGKTALALSLALNAARGGHGVAIASLEMTPEAMAVRALSEATSAAGNAVPYTSLRRGAISEHQMQTVIREAQHVAQLPITFLPRGYADIGALVAGARQIARSSPDALKLLIVDYAQLLRAEGRSRYEQITAVSMALKGLAMSLGIPVIALSQLSRQIESRDDKRPQLSDLRESGQLEQDADAVMFCYRDEYYVARRQPAPQDPAEKHLQWQDDLERCRNKMEVIVAKQRQGELGTAHLHCAMAMNRVWSD